MESTASHPRLSRQRLASPPRCKSARSRCRPLQNHKRSLHRNQQYSITALTDASGAIIERYAYTAYGSPTITDASGTTRTTTAFGNRYTYTGREWDEALALYHYRARMYDAVAGRFVSRDPIGFDGSRYGLYAFLAGLVLSAVDPYGLRTAVASPPGPRAPTTHPIPKGPTNPTAIPNIPSPTVPATAGTCRLVAYRIPHVAAFCAGVGVGYCFAEKCSFVETYIDITYWICDSDQNPPAPESKKKHKWKCTTKARNWDKGTPCYESIFSGTGKTEREAYDMAWNACVDEGCHAPGRGGDCGHVTCYATN